MYWSVFGHLLWGKFQQLDFLLDFLQNKTTLDKTRTGCTSYAPDKETLTDMWPRLTMDLMQDRSTQPVCSTKTPDSRRRVSWFFAAGARDAAYNNKKIIETWE